MWKWFAPLLIFAGKPEVLLRLLTLVIAAAVLAFGVWLFSNVALTFDALKNPYVEATYAVVLACFFIGVGTVTWLRVRRLAMPESHGPSRPRPEAPPLADEVVHRRGADIAKRWSGNEPRAQPSLAQPRVTAAIPLAPVESRRAADIRGSLMVTGPAYSGKTALIGSLVKATSTTALERSATVRLVDAGPIDGDRSDLDSLVAGAAAADGIMFVIDQDLRAPEVTAIARLIGSGKPLYVVLNKADQFTAADRDAILLSIRNKMPAKFAPGHVVSAAGAPAPIEREIEDARGAVRVELRRPSSDLQALTNLVRRVFAVAPGQTLKFEAA